MLDPFGVIKRIWCHPLNNGARSAALKRFLKWQLACRWFEVPVVIPFVNDTRLLMARGLHAATGNYYCGLMEYEEMAFLLHFLRKKDLFIDIGANIGSFTVLASGAVGAQSIAVEPSSTSYGWLQSNCALNALDERVELHRCAIGEQEGRIWITGNTSSSTNCVIPSSSRTKSGSVEVAMQPLDMILGDREPIMMKVDVEGYETAVLAGASKTLERSSLKCLAMEISIQGTRYGFNKNALFAAIRDHDFCPCVYNPVTRTLTQIEFAEFHPETTINGLFCRDIPFVEQRLRQAAAFTVLKRAL